LKVQATANQRTDASHKPGRPPAADATPEQRAEWGRLGGHRRAERNRERKAAVAAEVHLSTVADMRGFIETLAGDLKAASLDEARKATAGAALVRALTELDGFSEIVRERDALRAELAMVKTMGANAPDYACVRPAPLDGTAASVPVADPPGTDDTGSAP
jgi:hypothetical protein